MNNRIKTIFIKVIKVNDIINQFFVATKMVNITNNKLLY